MRFPLVCQCLFCRSCSEQVQLGAIRLTANLLKSAYVAVYTVYPPATRSLHLFIRVLPTPYIVYGGEIIFPMGYKIHWLYTMNLFKGCSTHITRVRCVRDVFISRWLSGRVCLLLVNERVLSCVPGCTGCVSVWLRRVSLCLNHILYTIFAPFVTVCPVVRGQSKVLNPQETTVRYTSTGLIYIPDLG